jgi:DNA-binding transcriptional MerR regulator
MLKKGNRSLSYTKTMQLSIGDLANVTGETVKTLRYWTNQGLLDTERGENNYRYYSRDMKQRAAFIRSTQALGFTLEDIKSILHLRAEGVQPCNEVRAELARHLTAVQERIMELKQLEAELSARLTWAEANPDPACDAEGCVYLTEAQSA